MQEKVGFSHSRFASSAHSASLSIFEYYFSLHVSPIYLSHAGYKKAVALLMGLYKREKFHMYSPALYRLKSRQPGAFLHPRADRSTSAMQNTLMERKTSAAADAIFISSIKPFSLSVFRTAFSLRNLLGVHADGRERGKLFLNFPT
jgi:hypothetical protein